MINTINTIEKSFQRIFVKDIAAVMFLANLAMHYRFVFLISPSIIICTNLLNLVLGLHPSSLFAKEYVEAMWLMLQQKNPKDYVIATGENHTVREFAELAFREVGIEIEWKGKGLSEKGINKKNNKVIIAIDPYYFRPTEVDTLMGDYSLAKSELGWRPRTKFNKLVQIMMEGEIKNTNL